MSIQKVAFITGGNRGLGFETAKQLGALGILPVIGARTAGQGEEALRKLNEFGITAKMIKFDANNQQDHQSAYDYFGKHFGRIDILINNAGVSLREIRYQLQKLRMQRVIFQNRYCVILWNLIFLAQYCLQKNYCL